MSDREPRPTGGPAAAPPALDWLNGDVATLRQEYERQRAKPMPPDTAWITIEQGGRTLRVLAPAAMPATKTAIVYFHGGGFIVGAPLTHCDITEALRRTSRLPLYSVDYGLAPEHKAPAPVEDGLAVIEHLKVLGFDKLLLAGDSAGGAIALAVEARLAGRPGAGIAGVASFYGAYGLFDTASLLRKGSRLDGTDKACIERYFDLAGGRGAYSLASLARSSEVPVYLIAAGDDPLRDDSLHLAEAMLRKGRSVFLDDVPGVDHGFLHRTGQSDVADETIRKAAAWLRRAAGAAG